MENYTKIVVIGLIFGEYYKKIEYIIVISIRKIYI